MKLELNKRYVTRDGRVTGPLHALGAYGYAFCCPILKFTWMEDGRFRDEGVSNKDLVSEYTKEGQPMFKVGDKVRYLVDESDGDIYVILALHKGQAWIEDEDTSTWVALVSNLAIVPEPKYIRKSIPELMAEGWVFDVHGTLKITEDGAQYTIGSVYLHLLGTENDSSFFDRSVYPRLWKEVK